MKTQRGSAREHRTLNSEDLRGGLRRPPGGSGRPPRWSWKTSLVVVEYLWGGLGRGRPPAVFTGYLRITCKGALSILNKIPRNLIFFLGLRARFEALFYPNCSRSSHFVFWTHAVLAVSELDPWGRNRVRDQLGQSLPRWWVWFLPEVGVLLLFSPYRGRSNPTATVRPNVSRSWNSKGTRH